jgi:glycosyltransferase involved in cell wall biosynthesis
MASKLKENSFPRICILIGGYFPFIGGAESHAKLLSKYLKKGNISVIVVTRRRNINWKKFNIVEEVPVYRVQPSGFKRWGKYMMMIPALIKLIYLRNRFDTIYVCGLRVLGIIGVIASKLLNKKCILRAESCGEFSGDFIWNSSKIKKHSIPGIIIQILIFLRNFILKKANCFLSISQTIRDEYLKCAVDPKKIVLIPNGIDTNKFRPVDEIKKKTIRKKLGLPYENIFAYTGKLNKGKGLELLLRTWGNIIHKNNNAHLVLVGGGDNQFLSCEHDLKSYVDKNNLNKFVIFTGYVNDVQNYLQASDFFVFPSESEAHPLSLLEALSCGLPAIATEAGGITDIITNKVNGKLIKINDEVQLEKNVIEFMENKVKAKQLGQAGRESVIKQFSIEKIAQQHKALFLKLSNKYHII